MKNKLEYPKEMLKFEEKHKQKVLDMIKENPDGRKKRSAKAIIYPLVVAAAVFVLLIGSSYFSLGAAKVAAKIPYFSLFIKQEEYRFAIFDVIGDVANDKGYQLGSSDLSVPDREITLGLRYSKADFDRIKDDVERNINKALVANNFGKFDIKLKRDRVVTVQEDSPEVEKYIRDSQELEKKIIEQLEKNQYVMAFPVQVTINEMEKRIYVAVPKTEKRIDELKAMLVSTSSPYGEFKLRISRIDMKAREQEIRWGKTGIIHILVGGLMENKEFKVTGFSYSFHPLPLQIKVKTSVNSKDPEASRLAERIVDEINTFIRTDDLAKEVRNDPYEITVLSKDKKKIN